MRCVAVIDFGSQTTMLIARKIRELSVCATIYPPHVTSSDIKDLNPYCIVLSGGPESLGDPGAPRIDKGILELGIPILGICYGMQLLVEHFNGKVSSAPSREFGERPIEFFTSVLFEGVEQKTSVWMSHSDQVDIENTPFKTIAATASCPHAAIAYSEKKIYGVQFHPEVAHTSCGITILKNFVFSVARSKAQFSLAQLIEEKTEVIKNTVKDGRVIMGLSGGVDSTVAAVLIHRAIKDRLHCVYVNHGLNRKDEIAELENLFLNKEIKLHIIDAEEQFFSALLGVSDPEEKRKAIGRTFIEIFEQEANRLQNIEFLGQGTLYSDVIESASYAGKAKHTIKSHHNVGGLPERMNLKIIEPLRDLFKDEVRKLGQLLSISKDLIERQPFPGPGLSVRIPGEVTKTRVITLQLADSIVRDEIGKAIESSDINNQLWQWFAILLPVKSIGVMGDHRSEGEAIVIRAVESIDAMTADWAKLSYSLLTRISNRITNEVPGITRVLYDITQKPPGTIEWE